ncbi:DUF2510 domain-containing protein [Microbacterium sp. NPDC088619]|uniref:DUF2510 domain-containing protein n=1 Tax=Microbacterium sp. NPDC088619 TaxID=3364196 RepID=UPI00381A834F
MSGGGPASPGWYDVHRRTQRWWDGRQWTENVIHHGRPTTATALRAATTRMQWMWVGVGVVAWVAFLVFSFAFGPSAAFALALLPVAGTAAIVASAITGSRLIAAVPPTPGGPVHAR